MWSKEAGLTMLSRSLRYLYIYIYIQIGVIGACVKCGVVNGKKYISFAFAFSISKPYFEICVIWYSPKLIASRYQCQIYPNKRFILCIIAHCSNHCFVWLMGQLGLTKPNYLPVFELSFITSLYMTVLIEIILSDIS